MKKKEYQKRIEKEKRDMKKYNERNASMKPKTAIIILVSVVAFVFLMLVFTKVKTGEWNLFSKKNSTNYTAEIQSEKILCGGVLDRLDSEYFVLAYEMKEDSATLYNSIIERYNETSPSVPIYKLDLSNSRNGICKSENAVISNNIEELKFVMPTLIKVSNKQIVNSYTNSDDIKNILLNSTN